MIRLRLFPRNRSWWLSVMLMAGLWLGSGSCRAFALEDASSGLLKIWNREIVTFRATVHGKTPDVRSEHALKQIREIPEFKLFKPIQITKGIFEGQQTRILSMDGYNLFALFELDVLPGTNESLDDLADQVRLNLEELRDARLRQSRPELLLRGGLKALAATGVYLLIAFISRRLNLWVLGRLRKRAVRMKTLTREGLDLRPTLVQVLKRISSLSYFLVILVFGYLWLTYVLALFPFTAPVSERLGDNLFHRLEGLAENVVQALPGLLLVMLIFFATRGLVRILNQVLDNLKETTGDNDFLGRDTAKATRRIAGVLIWIFALVLAYPYIPGSDSEAFKGIGVLVGLMLSLGSSGFVNQLMSGFVVLYSGAVRSDEYVRAGDWEGRIREIGLLATTIYTPKGERISIPNSVLIQQSCINYTRQSDDGKVVELSTTVTIGYDTPWPQVHEALLEAAGHCPGVRKDPEPYVLQVALSDYYVEYELRVTPGDPSKRVQILSKLHEHILNSFHSRDLQIMSPHFHMQPEQPVIPEKTQD